MNSNITIHIVELGSTPIEPVVPNTGLFTHGIGGPEATILGISAAVIILAVIVAVHTTSISVVAMLTLPTSMKGTTVTPYAVLLSS